MQVKGLECATFSAYHYISCAFLLTKFLDLPFVLFFLHYIYFLCLTSLVEDGPKEASSHCEGFDPDRFLGVGPCLAQVYVGH